MNIKMHRLLYESFVFDNFIVIFSKGNKNSNWIKNSYLKTIKFLLTSDDIFGEQRRSNFSYVVWDVIIMNSHSSYESFVTTLIIITRTHTRPSNKEKQEKTVLPMLAVFCGLSLYRASYWIFSALSGLVG